MGGRDDPLADYEATRERINRWPESEVTAASHEEPTEDDDLTLSDFSPTAVSDTLQNLAGLGPDAQAAKKDFDDAQQQYAQAVALREQGEADESVKQFLAAAKRFEKAAKGWPKSRLEQDALFMVGESYFFADRYPKAEAAYEQLLKQHPHSRYLDQVQPRRFAMAEYWLSLSREDPQSFYELNVADASRPGRDTYGHALRIFNRIRLDDPTGRLADDATMAIANAHFANGQFLLADEHFTDLRKTFPSSEFQYHAHLLGMKSKLLTYEGPDYSGVPLNEAETLFDQLRKQFPMQIRDDAEYLATEGARIQFLQAERLWERAQRRDRRAEYGAAKFYYDLLLRDFEDTPFATKAAARVAEIQGLPNVPPTRLSWLTSLFPDEETVQPLLTNDSVIRR